MQNSTNMRILELLRFLYERTDENHPATVSDIIAHLNGKGIQAVRQTVYADTNALIDAGIDIVVVKSTQNQYFMGSRPFEYPELKMLTDAVASSKIISAKKSEELVQKLCRLTSTHQAEQLQKFAALSSRVKPHNEKVYYGKRCGFSKRYFLVLVACRHLTCTKTECRKMFLSLIAPLTTIRLNRGKRSNRLPYIFAQGQER